MRDDFAFILSGKTMAEPAEPAEPAQKPNVVEEIVNAGKEAFDPSLDAASRDTGLVKYNNVLQR